jgi:hypothetical protein
LEISEDEKNAVIGTAENPIVRPRTKNFIEAPEKAFKTTFLLRLMAGLSCNETIFSQLKVPKTRSVLYLLGELSRPEVQSRIQGATAGLNGEFDNFSIGTVLDAHLIQPEGQDVIRELLGEHRPENLVLDPWQAFITGSDENSYKDISQATKFCDQLIDEFGVTLWIPIHTGKDRTKGARGHSIIGGWRDTRFQLERKGETGLSVKVEPRWAEPLRPFQLRLDRSTLRPDKAISWSGQTGDVVDFVRSSGGTASLGALAGLLRRADDSKGKEAFRKIIERAVKAGAVIKGEDSVSLPLSEAVAELAA